MLDHPRSVPAYDERLSALEDPALAERLLAENPELFRAHLREAFVGPAGDAPPVPAWRRLGAGAVVLVAVGTLLAGSVLYPLLTKRPAPQTAVRRTVAGAPPKPAGQHEKPHNPIGTVPHEDATLRAELAKQQREIERLRASLVAQTAAQRTAPTAAPRSAVPVRHAAEPAPSRAAAMPATRPIQRYDSKPVWDVRPATKAGAAESVSTSSSTSVSTSTAVAATSGADAADASMPPMTDAPMPDGTKGAPPAGTGHWNEHGPYGVGAGTGSCSPSRDSMTTGLGGSGLSHVGGGGRY